MWEISLTLKFRTVSSFVQNNTHCKMIVENIHLRREVKHSHVSCSAERLALMLMAK
jgi:hypothetical protein